MEQAVIVYILTFLMRSGTFAMLGLLSRIKKPMSDDLNYTQEYLGLISFLIYSGRAIGAIIICLYPQKKIKHITIRSTIFFCLFILFFPLAGLKQSSSKILIGIGSITNGFSRAFTTSVYSLLRQFMGKTHLQQKLVLFWMSSSYFGDIIGILFAEMLLEYFQLSWEASITISSILLLIVCLLSQILIEDVTVTNNDQNQNQNMNALLEFYHYCRRYFQKFSNLLYLLSYVGLGSVYFTTLMWLPYYFTTIGFTQTSSYIAIVFPCAYVIGNLLYSYLVNNIFKLKFVGYLHLILIVINILMSYILTTLRDDPEHLILYCVIFVILGLFFAGPQARLFSYEIDCHISNSYERMRMLYLLQIFQPIVSALLFLLSGYILEKNIYSLFWLLTGVSIFSLITYMFRVYLYPEQFINSKKEMMQIAGVNSNQDI